MIGAQQVREWISHPRREEEEGHLDTKETKETDSGNHCVEFAVVHIWQKLWCVEKNSNAEGFLEEGVRRGGGWITVR